MIKEIDQIEEFDDLTPLKKIKQIMPDFLFKGSDYSIKDVVGYKEIKKNGGKVIILKIIKILVHLNLLNNDYSNWWSRFYRVKFN